MRPICSDIPSKEPDLPTFDLKEVGIILRDGDDVAVLTRPMPAGDEVEWNGGSLRLDRDVSAGHKVALADVKEGAPVHKYGQVIGYATADIRPGDWVHSHNLHNGHLGLEYEFGTDV